MLSTPWQHHASTNSKPLISHHFGSDLLDPIGLGGDDVLYADASAVDEVAINNGSCRIIRTAEADWCFLSGLHGNPGASRVSQTEAVFADVDAALATAGFLTTDIIRTWFYLDDILAWYDDFNATRDGWFRRHGMFDSVVPVSTGIGASNHAGSAIHLDVIAVRPKGAALNYRAVASPRQCPALDYGSSFSRALALDYADRRGVLVSGTASIAQEGHTIHVGDSHAQMIETMCVIDAILSAEGCSWSDVTRGVAYYRNGDERALFAKVCTELGIPTLPVVDTAQVVCRDDLLFELEVDAWRSLPS
ncbi:MAG: hypothetical protein ACYTF0_04475 [Planctomycetota bacterium]